MNCECGSDSKVIETRTVGGNVRRRRECLRCKKRFSTFELSADSINEVWKQLQVAKAAFVAMGKNVKGIKE